MYWQLIGRFHDLRHLKLSVNKQESRPIHILYLKNLLTILNQKMNVDPADCRKVWLQVPYKLGAIHGNISVCLPAIWGASNRGICHLTEYFDIHHDGKRKKVQLMDSIIQHLVQSRFHRCQIILLYGNLTCCTIPDMVMVYHTEL